MQATTRWSFRSTIINGDTEFLDLVPFNVLAMFGDMPVADTIDLAATGVGYALARTAPPAAPEQPQVAALAFGSLTASSRMAVRSGGRRPDRAAVPLSACGDPTLNIRLPLEARP